jgi:glutathione synthase/RimK-type ligase-like ATP-grasp enzyme
MNSRFKNFAKRLLRISFISRWVRKYLIVRKGYITKEQFVEFLNEAEDVAICWEDNIVKPFVAIVKERESIFDDLAALTNYDLKFEKFLKHNKIPYEFYDIHSSDWLKNASRFDIFVWRTHSSPAAQYEAETKIYILEKVLTKICLPSYAELWSYEDKLRMSFLLKIHGLPGVDTFITFNHKEALSYSDANVFPVVSKISTGSASKGVELIRNSKEGKKLINKIFGSGYKTYWKYLKQKNYIYWQKFIHDAVFDLRILVVDNKLFGSYRYPRKGDFRASGSGVHEYGDLPQEAMRIAIQTHKKLNTRFLAVDFVYSPSQKRYFIIEASVFISLGTAPELIINGVPGYYSYSEKDDSFTFEKGKYWVQEFTLKTVMLEWIESQKK